MIEKVILVDTKDNEVGSMEKQEAHVKGLLHRAFSIFIFTLIVILKIYEIRIKNYTKNKKILSIEASSYKDFYLCIFIDILLNFLK